MHCDKVMRPTNNRTVLWDLLVEQGLEKMWWPLWPETKGDGLIPDEACDRMSRPSIQTSLKKRQLSSRASLRHARQSNNSGPLRSIV